MKKIVMIGAGNVATHISRTLAAVGYAPVQVWSRSMKSASTLAEEVGSEAVDSLDSVVGDADMYVISVVDKALPSVVGELCRNHRHGVFVHTAGTMPMQLFEGHAEHYGVLYPMQTFSKQKALDFGEVPCFVEASDADSLMAVRQVADVLSRHVYELSGDKRRWLHVAAVFACNFTNACYAMAAHILEEHGLDFNVMLPLIDETTRKLHSLHPVDAQTGPASRGDRNVVNSHLDMLGEDTDLRDIYRIMSEQIMRTGEGLYNKID